MANFPVSEPTFTTKNNGDVIMSGDINQISSELLAVIKTLDAGGYGGNNDPATINDGILQVNYNTAITVNSVNRVGGVLSVLASQIRKITGASWLTTPPIDLTVTKNLNFITRTDQSAIFPNSKTIGYTVQRGLASAQPAANTVDIGVLYFASDTGIFSRSNGATWDLVSYLPIGTLVADSLLRYDGTKIVPLIPPASTGNIVLQHSTVSGFTWTGLPANYQVLTSPSVYDPQTKGFVFYTTIQQACDNAWAPKLVLIPPGNYTEDVVVTTPGVAIIEIIPNTVTITGSITFNCGTGQGDFILQIYSIVHTNSDPNAFAVRIIASANNVYINLHDVTNIDSSARAFTIFDVTSITTSVYITVEILTGYANGNITYVTANLAYVEFKLTGSSYVAQIGGTLQVLANVSSSAIVNILGGGIFRTVSKPYTFVVSTPANLRIFNISLPTTTLLPTSIGTMLSADRISQQDIQSIVGLVTAFNTFI